MAEALLTPEAAAMVGKSLPRLQGTVYRKEFQRWARAVNDHNPLYFDQAYAEANGYRALVMPPLFLRHVMHDAVRLEDLRADGTGGPAALDIPLPPKRMAGGEQTTFHEVIYDGDVLTADGRLKDLMEKTGRSGSFVLARFETVYRNQDDVVVAISTHSQIAR
jgi:acyl dehydratase